MVFVCKEEIKAADLAKKLAADLGLEADGIKLFLKDHYVDTIHLFSKNLTTDMFFVVSEKGIFNNIAQKAKELPYLVLYKG